MTMTTNWELINAQKRIQQLRERNGIHPLLLSSASDSSWLETLRQPNGGMDTPPPAAAAQQEPPQPPPSVFRDEMEHHGDIAIAAMRGGYSSHYQLWLLLHLMDRPGSGRLDLDKVKLHLTELVSKHKTWEWPRVRSLLQEGDGRFWHVTADWSRVYYTTHARLAAALGIEKLNGRFATIQAEHVKGTSAATFRAHCFAGWLANHTNPISRRTIERLTGITPRTQRRYCQLAGIEQQANICIGPKASTEQMQECAWHYSGTFTFTDFLGKQGSRQGAQYVAWHLPAAYDGTAATGSRSQQRRVNGHIRNLVNTGVRGNDDMFARELRPERSRLFFENGAHAAKAINRGHEQDAYWPTKKAKTGTGLWHVFH